MSEQQGASRRDFMKSAAAGAAVFAIGQQRAEAASGDVIRVGLIGSGRRGNGAVRNCFDASPDVRLVAQCDLFEDQLADSRTKLATLGDRYQVTDETAFHGFGGYKQVLAADVDMVILATPPAYRALTLRAAIEAGKHVFMEKPAGVDPQQVKSVIESGEMAKAKGLSIVAGTQRRHQAAYIETIKAIHDGGLGDIVSAACYWVGDYGYYPGIPRQDGWSDMEYHNRNWNYFTWLSGDHIVEQHVHNIDIMNWVLGAHPVSAVGLGGRAQRTAPEFGHIYDHFSVEFEYPGGIRVQSLCRQNSDTYSRVAEYVAGTKGTSDCRSHIKGSKFRYKADNDVDPYVQEHRDLIAAIQNNEPINKARDVAESTMAAIIGRMSAYSGQEVQWDWAMNESKLDLAPPTYQFGDLPPVEVAVPGVTPLV
ncbi:MAG: twin-arginine translocation signal domain-containing protein [Candidatus Hydrogenedens sp.]|nr:twin-arginine translocation signal domain-containing protein [Candidatus Hydrogenedens sp.]